jgi:NADPH:quinone reductase-like Zn-dependent oxidoreductase
MKAIVYHEYGSPDVLKCEEIEKPIPEDNQVLIKVRAASINPADWHYMRGTPYLMRMESGLSKPKQTRFGLDVAGEIETVGKSITQFKPGDAVFGSCRGALAEYVCALESKLTLKPKTVSFEQAAAVPVAAYTALQGLRDQGKLQLGQKVLINGAAGGVGTFAVQIAKAFGAEVTGVCSTRNVEMVRSIGADRVIDYTKEDFTRSEQRYDLFLDNIGNHSLLKCRRVLTPKGRYVMVGGRSGRWFAPMGRALSSLIVSRFVSQDLVFFIAQVSQKDLTTMSELMATGKVTPVIDKRYKLSEVAEAVRYLEAGHARGKVVVTLD